MSRSPRGAKEQRPALVNSVVPMEGGPQLAPSRYNAAGSVLGSEEKVGAPFLAVFEKWAAVPLAP